MDLGGPIGRIDALYFCFILEVELVMVCQVDQIGVGAALRHLVQFDCAGYARVACEIDFLVVGHVRCVPIRGAFARQLRAPILQFQRAAFNI
jgi:hypothetical protein